ncbi:RING finger protein 17 [Pristis pectinata]|uniref:RING finger protein 17 n=1 Tax=Pristis pectinata TaxID=685728 RepID=UPI00223CB260|nr:RING finger protein 17 [Pristis pectinata]
MAEGSGGTARDTCSRCRRPFQFLERKLHQKYNCTTEELSAICFEQESNAINDGLCKMCERDQYNNLLQRVEGVGFSIEKERNGIRNEMHKEFEKIYQSLKNRKDVLLKELEFIDQQYLIAIGEVQKIFEEKINALDSALQNEVEPKHEFLSAYCNEQQITENLKNLDQAKCMIEMLESRIDLRFQIQPGPLITALATLGKIELGTEKFLTSRTENILFNAVFEKIIKQSCQPREGQNLESYKNESSAIKVDSVMDCNVNGPTMVVSRLSNGPVLEEKSLLHNQSRLCLARDTDVEGIFEDNKPSIICDNDLKFLRPVLKRQKQTFHRKHVSDLGFGCHAGFQGLVSVSHVINPCHFYVQKSSEKQKAALLAAEADNLYRSMDMQNCPAAVLELDERIIVKSNIFHAWCRGTITELVPSGEKEEKFNNSTSYQITDLAVIQVFLLDFGHTEILLLPGVDSPVKKLEDGVHVCAHVSDFSLCVRKLNPQLKGPLNNTAPLAIKCSLKDIVPANPSNIWNVEARNEFTRIVDNKAVQMIVLGEEGDRLLVDLQKPPLDKMENDVPVSLRDALVFLELARFVNECSVPTSNLETNQLSMRYYPPVIPPFLKEIQIMVTHINSPLDFYIQLIDNVDLLILTRNMYELYTGKDVSLEILCPVVGQACAALFDDGGWYRCQINGLPGHKEVDVKYVDYGNTARIPVSKIRKLKGDFLTLPVQALQCRLSNVEPANTAEGWNDCVKERFKHLTLNKCMWCITCESLGNILSVYLLDSSMQVNGTKPCINNILVEENLASFTQNCSTDIVVEHNNRAPNFKQIYESKELDVCQDVVKSQLFKGMDLLMEGQSKNVSDLDQHVDVKVTFVASPSSIFVQTLVSQRLLKDLQEEMKDVYSSSEHDRVEWEEDRDCALLVSETKEWRRGKITKVISDKVVEVFCYDFGNKEIVNSCKLRQLKEEFQFEPLALECCLSSIRPTGGSLKWAATSCDFLEDILIGSSVLIKIEESSSKSPLQVKLYTKDEIGQFVNIARYLIKKGLALPQKISPAPDYRNVRNELKQNNRHESLGQAPEIVEYLAPSHEDCPSRKVYKPPVVPNMNTFNVEVTGVGDDGVIYGMLVSLKAQFTMLTSAIQTTIKVLPFLKPYCYSKDEGCIVKGSDTLWYRGRILEVLGGSVKVHYVDRGYAETIPQCHVYPVLVYPDIPELCLPFQLYGVTPVGNKWQEDAIHTLRELLVHRILEVEIKVPSENRTPMLLVDLRLDGMSVSYFMIHHNHAVQTKKAALTLKKDSCGLSNEETISEENWDLTLEGLLSSQFETVMLLEYDYPLLPLPGKVFPVTVKHLETPNQVFVSLGVWKDFGPDSDTDDSGINYESEDDLEQSLRELNPNAEALPLLTDFRSEMPCLAEYSDGRWYRAKVLSVDKLHPLMILVQHVDFGSTALLQHTRLRQIPAHLVKHPARAIKVKLAGFKPPAIMNEMNRLTYSPEWSMEALRTVVDMVQGNQLTAFLVSLHPEVSVFLYKEGSLIHLPLVERGLADLDM